MIKGYSLFHLAKSTIIEPIKGFRAALEYEWTFARALELNILVVVVTVLVQAATLSVSEAISGEEIDPILSTSGPLLDALLTATLHTCVIIGIWVMGRVSARGTSITDVMVMFGWLQLLLLAASIASLPLILLVPPLGLLATVILAIFAQPYYLVCGTMSVHGFDKPLNVIGGLLLVAFVIALFLQPLLFAFGIELMVPTNV
ncbi:MAG: hypothetical protein AAF198_08390 [Pseudomonadota bacterium]